MQSDHHEDLRSDFVERELERGHGAEVPTASTQRPEEVGVPLEIRVQQLPVRGHDVGREEAVA